MLYIGVGIGWLTYGQVSKVMGMDIESKGDIEKQTVELKPMITNLADGRYTKLSLVVVVSDKNAADELAKREFQVQNQALKLIGELDAETLQRRDEQLVEPLKEFLDEVLNSGEVVDVLITEKIIQ